ncbi:6-phosphogluconolactonase [Buchnera aphidicola (Cinara kochiana kochiana)]|uniref:6-phosphogluconolactonase n=1 Tax=Buchnera aphidicola (Cinara kochiana kochiana) TaxID=2518976 RepID=A0A451D5X2_9GAMM|nr:beta-propeller fold lactonase family protein [Buchnera aphidicola]VFP81104.1 6-phosphogluconolactonase [Buchnera aphidicola (Cinara kochiana kochiana)]
MKKNIFISCSLNKHIEHWTLTENYILLKKSIFYTTGYPQPLKYNQKDKLLYVGETINNKIVTYKKYLNNQFKKIHEIKLSHTPNYISLNKNKTVLLMASYHGNRFKTFSLNSIGLINNISCIVKNIQGCHCIKIHYKYNLIFVSALKENKIYIYSIFFKKNTKITIVLKNIVYTVQKSGPRHMVFHPLNPFVYSINELNGTIDVWKIDNQLITLILIQSISLISDAQTHHFWASDIHIHPSKKYLYACDRFHSIISFFSINDTTGILLHKYTYKTILQPRSFCISKDGKILIVVGEISNSMMIYRINNHTGYLAVKKEISIGNNPLWVLIE